MNDYYQKLIEELNRQNPGMLPENAAAQAPDAVQQELASRIPTSDPSNFDVHVSDNTVTQDGKIQGSDAPPSPIMTPPADDIKLPEPAPVDTVSVAAPTKPTAVDSKGTPPVDLAAITAPGKPDEAPPRGKRNPLPILAGGIGDAISASASAFGGNAPGGSAQRIAEYQDKELARQKLEGEDKIKEDPNSAVSKNYRNMVLQMVPDLAKNPDFANMSAKMIGDKLPMIDTMMKAQAQKDMKELGMQQLKAQKEAANTAKMDIDTEKRLKLLGDDLDPSRFRAGNFAVSEQTFNRAEKLQSLASAFKDGNLDSRQVEELAIGLNAMLSGSNVGAQQQVKALVPHSALGNANKMAEWLLNSPRGLQQQEFVNRILGTVQREKDTAEEQMNRVRFSRIAKYADLENKNPSAFQSILQSNHVDPVKYQDWKDNGYQFKSAVQGPDGHKKHGQPAGKGNPLGLDL